MGLQVCDSWLTFCYFGPSSRTEPRQLLEQKSWSSLVFPPAFWTWRLNLSALTKLQRIKQDAVSTFGIRIQICLLVFRLFPFIFPSPGFFSSPAFTNRLHRQIDLSLHPEGLTAWVCGHFFSLCGKSSSALIWLSEEPAEVWCVGAEGLQVQEGENVSDLP